VGEAYFPNWGRDGWQATGQRVDRLSGHSATTVYYQGHGERIAYTILSAPPLATPRAQVLAVGGLQLRELRLGGRTVVTWRRAGHTCVLSGVRVAALRLAQLAGSVGPAR
jgi:hypothetical protein